MAIDAITCEDVISDIDGKPQKVVSVDSYISGGTYAINTVDGLVLECSGDHLFYVYDEVSREYAWRDAKSLDKTCYMLSPIALGNPNHCKQTSKYVKHKVSNVYLSSEPVRIYNISVDGQDEAYIS